MGNPAGSSRLPERVLTRKLDSIETDILNAKVETEAPWKLSAWKESQQFSLYPRFSIIHFNTVCPDPLYCPEDILKCFVPCIL